MCKNVKGSRASCYDLLVKWMWALLIYGAVSLMGDPKATLSQRLHQQDVIATCLVLEAGGEGERGMQAVMNVIQNRAEGRTSQYYSQVIAPKQFKVFNNAPGFVFRDFSDSIKKAKASPAWPISKQLVDKAFRNELADITGGATHFYSFGRATPTWAKHYQESVVIGSHRFMKDPLKPPPADG